MRVQEGRLLAPRAAVDREPNCSHDPSRCAGRYVNLAKAGTVKRGNAISTRRSEYIVHGWFGQSDEDDNGIPGAYWVPIAKLFSDMSDRKTVVEALEDFEESMAQQREDEMAELEGEEGEGETGG